MKSWWLLYTLDFHKSGKRATVSNSGNNPWHRLSNRPNKTCIVRSKKPCIKHTSTHTLSHTHRSDVLDNPLFPPTSLPLDTIHYVTHMSLWSSCRPFKCSNISPTSWRLSGAEVEKQQGAEGHQEVGKEGGTEIKGRERLAVTVGGRNFVLAQIE